MNVLSPLENNMYSSLARWSILLISVRFSWLMAFVDLVGSIFLYLACLFIYLGFVCLITEKRVLQALIVDLALYHFSSQIITLCILQSF